MGMGRQSNSGWGRIRSGIASHTLVSRTLSFVIEQLPRWRDDPKRPVESSENRLNAQLCKFLDSAARHHLPMVRFDHEEPQTGHRQIDLAASPAQSTGISSIYEPFLLFECKRLPLPDKSRAREYVTKGKGNSGGGIQRFKIGAYAPNHDIAGMIAYIQKETTQQWWRRINAWIDELAGIADADMCPWSGDEKLEELVGDNENGTATCHSEHIRIGAVKSSTIQLSHLWVDMRE